MEVDFEVLEHTADFAFEVRAADLPSLLASCAVVASRSMFGDVGLCEGATEHVLTVDEADPAMAVYEVLSEVLYLLDARRLVVCDARARREGGGRLRVSLTCVPLDPARHRHKVLFKAVTLHGLEVTPAGGGLRARVVMDV